VYFDALMADKRAKDRAYDAQRRGAPTPEQVAEAIKNDPSITRAAREAVAEVDRKRSIRDAVPGNKDYYDDPRPDQASLIMRMRSVRHMMQEILGWTINLRGLGADELRAGVFEEIAHWRSYITAIEEAAEGRSLDAEIERLLSEESR
jgi:hypothetical protein